MLAEIVTKEDSVHVTFDKLIKIIKRYSVFAGFVICYTIFQGCRMVVAHSDHFCPRIADTCGQVGASSKSENSKSDFSFHFIDPFCEVIIYNYLLVSGIKTTSRR